MKVSIITATFNCESTIGNALESIESQSYQEIEHIVIDGKSADNTVEIVRNYGRARIISEPDHGIYDALNKGIKLSTGDFVGFLHADDTFAGESVVGDMVEKLIASGTDGVYGDLVYVRKNGSVLRYWRSGVYSISKLNKGWMPPHPTLFLRREIYENFGLFDTTFKISSDYEFMLRILLRGITLSYLDYPLVRMQIGGASNRSLQNILRKSREDLNAMRKNQIPNASKTLLLKNASKLGQFFRR